MSTEESRKRKLECLSGAESEASDQMDVTASAGSAHSGDPDTVTFDVQGEKFRVLTSTIRRHPETLLCTLLDTESDLSKPIFVEGDKALFPYILSWYRHASSNRIRIPITVSKPALELECRTFALPDDVRVERESVVEMMPGIAAALEEELGEMKGAERKQALDVQKQHFDVRYAKAFQKAVKAEVAELKSTAEANYLTSKTKFNATDQAYEQAVAAAKKAVAAAEEQRAKVGIEYMASVISAGLLEAVADCGNGLTFQLPVPEKDCHLRIELPQCSACKEKDSSLGQLVKIITGCPAMQRYFGRSDKREELAKALSSHGFPFIPANRDLLQRLIIAPTGLQVTQPAVADWTVCPKHGKRCRSIAVGFGLSMKPQAQG
mmetsp:Transcript_47435/g.112790  ORF Transcript_47435/g.112790 Transcript_47435/m.112790 type:complete len:378 (+) Transcript_47435:66-1199(+)